MTTKSIKIPKLLLLPMLFVALVLIIPSCGDNEDPDTCETTDLTYGNFAEDFLNDNCATSGCHDANAVANNVPGPMHDYASAKAYVDMGRVIGAINHTDGFSNMPKGQEKMSDCDISRLTAWIVDGAPE